MDADRADAVDFTKMRVGYSGGPGSERLDIADLDDGWAPLFSRWLAESESAGVREPNAMVLATVGSNGRPSTRTVLLKGITESTSAGAVAVQPSLLFFTNYNSRKGKDMVATGVAAATFLWIGSERQVHFEGACRRLGAQESARYWESRPRGAQVAAWASQQSEEIGSIVELDALLVAATTRFAEVEKIPMPERWGGYLLIPDRVEFWRGGRDRFHDRIQARRRGGSWVVGRLQP